MKETLDEESRQSLIEKRHSSDYEAFAYCDKAMVNELTPMATAFIERIKEILE